MIKAFAITDIGKKRKMNQDYAYVSLNPVGKLPNIFIVADGMGGHNAGGYASRCAVDIILEEAEKLKDSDLDEMNIILQAIDKANEYIKRRAGEDFRLSGMGTTVVAATCEKDRLTVANVGDSRLYIINEHQIRQITQDHSLVEEMVRYGAVSREQARNHPDKNIITRAVGAEDHVRTDCFYEELKEKDIVLLCSDGLTGMLEDEEIRTIAAGMGTLEERAEALVEAANNKGGRDNIAVIMIDPFS